ncbi:hypothetical protein [Pseudobacter ginsenosidimutans]|uniref:Uncharacterized protein n=1 Tax=Pseudobacter ginsenosidimutans TaxID=661488 RepID=A0A4Q7MXH2_9BACT|nr:hypothetical protein [Pseudobacter ginsenosidimutans]QEC41419.1 hypothetical protein FSB84_06820 [Pseudobacter ginsenosidimutans]RZS71800.1 hypothetical protein EV199_3713 [Pseudobacter ginsenosidimutans]
MKLPEFEGKLADLDDEAVEECVLAGIRSFGHQFTQEELSQLETLGDFYNLVESKFAKRHSPECTSQQAFYKLRQCIADILKIDKNSITPSSSLEELFPRKIRWRKMKQLRQHMGIKARLLEMKGWLRSLFAFSIVASLVMLFFSWIPAMIALVSLILLNRITAIFNNELSYPNLRELAEYLAIFEYAAVRRDPETANLYEVRAVINQVFIRREQLKMEHLTPEQKLIQ